MQLLLATARQVLNNPNLTTTQLIQPKTNIEAGTKFIAYNWERFGNMRDAIAAYNAGSPRLTSAGKYVNQDYVDKVTNFYDQYKKMGIAVAAEDFIPTNLSLDNPLPLAVYAVLGAGAFGMIFLARKGE